MQQPILMVNYSIDMEQDWHVTHGYKGLAFAIKRPDGGTVCTLSDGLRPEEKQLATLISATPQMLEALMAAEKVLRFYTAEDCAAYSAQEKIHAAIKKAKGESNE